MGSGSSNLRMCHFLGGSGAGTFIWGKWVVLWMASACLVAMVECMWFCGGLRVLRWLRNIALLLGQVVRLGLSVRK